MLLEQPGRIGGLRLKNRVVMAPMGTNYSTTDGLSTERDKLYYAERARGGVAMVMTEAMVVTEHARPHHNSLCCYHDRFIPGLASIVEAIKAHDCHVFGQLNHRGALLRRSVLNMEPVGPSPWKNPNTGDEVRPLAIAEIVEIQKLFVEAARRLRQAGYDGAEIHAGNGYLFQQFFTPRINRRTDCYGGSFDNRARFLIETIRRVRDALPDFPLIVRLSAAEFAEGSYTGAEIVELAARLEHEAVAALDLSGGSNESPQLSKYCIQPPSFKRDCLGPYAKPVKQAVGIPVFIAGRVVDPEDAEALLREGCADFISLGRALYADPHWCLKAFGRVNAPIRKCIACNLCFERLTLEKDVACIHNPMIGTEFEALDTVAGGMARNNRMELLDRLNARGTEILIGVTVEEVQGTSLELRAADGSARSVAIGDCLIVATGPEPDRDVVPLIEEAGVEYALAGDCARAGDFLSCLRDAWMVALSVEHRFRNATTCGAHAPSSQYA